MTVAAIADELHGETARVLAELLATAVEATGAEHGRVRLLSPGGAVEHEITDEPDNGRSVPPAAAGRPPERGPKREPDYLIADIRLSDDFRGELHLGRAGGPPFTLQELRTADGLASLAGQVLDNARARSLGERRRRWLETLGDLTSRLLPPITLPEALARITDAIAQASGARAAMIVQLPPGGPPFLAARSGTSDELDEEEQSECHLAAREVVETGVVTERGLGAGRVALLAPLRAQLTLQGALLLVHARQPDAEERALLASFADHAGLVLDRTQALEDRHQLAVISDRDRIARDLHDVVIQRLFAAGLQLHSAVTTTADPALRERLESTVRDLDQTIRDIRGTIFDLTSRPRSSVRSYLADVVSDLTPMLGFAPSVHLSGAVDSPVDPGLQQSLGSVLREALLNVAQHADATAASVELQLTAGHLRLRVTDNGVGVAEGEVERGLRAIRRRTALLGGSLDLWPSEPSGTCLVWAVPLTVQP